MTTLFGENYPEKEEKRTRTTNENKNKNNERNASRHRIGNVGCTRE